MENTHPSDCGESLEAETNRTLPQVKGTSYLSNGLFYTLHPSLISSIERHAPDFFAVDSLQMEKSESQKHGNHAGTVGNWSDRPISYLLLQQLPSSVEALGPRPANWKDDPFWKLIGGWWNPEAVALGEKMANWSNLMCSGFCGWLLTNPLFIAEHDDFFETYRDPLSALKSLPPLDNRFAAVSSGLRPCQDAYISFCGRWDLASLSGPYLPVPLQPQFPVAKGMLHLLPATSLGGGVLIYLPRTHPIPEREALRGLIEDALSRSAVPDHLREWIELIDAKNPGKKGIRRYARLFKLQHWWRLLHHRYGGNMAGHVERLQQAFAEFQLGDDPQLKHFQTVRDDLSDISKALGSDWHKRSNALTHFTF